MFVLDTNVVSELRKVRAGKANPGVAEWASGVPSGQLFVSVITIHELEHGVALAERADPERGAVLRTWLDGSVAPAFASRALAIDEPVARRAAALHVRLLRLSGMQWSGRRPWSTGWRSSPAT